MGCGSQRVIHGKAKVPAAGSTAAGPGTRGGGFQRPSAPEPERFSRRAAETQSAAAAQTFRVFSAGSACLCVARRQATQTGVSA